MSRYARSSARYTMADELRSCVGRSLRFNRRVVKWFTIRAVCENIMEKIGRTFVLFSPVVWIVSIFALRFCADFMCCIFGALSCLDAVLIGVVMFSR